MSQYSSHCVFAFCVIKHSVLGGYYLPYLININIWQTQV